MAIKYFLRDTNVDTTCDTTAKARDLDQTQGTTSPMTSDTTSSESWVEVLSLDEDVSGDSPASGSHDLSLNVNTFSPGADWRCRLRAVNDSGCGITNSSAYSAIFRSNGIKTFSLSLTWGGSADRLRLSFEIRRDLGAHGNKSINIHVNDADSFVNAPFGAAPANRLVPGISVANL